VGSAHEFYSSGWWSLELLKVAINEKEKKYLYILVIWVCRSIPQAE
jgi:hypothetical protein